MSLLETSGFDTGEIRRALDEYDRREQRRSVQMGAVFLQSMRLLEDAGRLYEENDRLREMVQDLSSFVRWVIEQWGSNLEADGADVQAPPAEWKQCLYELDMLAERMSGLGIEVEE